MFVLFAGLAGFIFGFWLTFAGFIFGYWPSLRVTAFRKATANGIAFACVFISIFLAIYFLRSKR